LSAINNSKHAVVSIGTNSTRLLIVERTGDGKLVPILQRSIGTRLGANLQERGPLDPEAVARTLAVIEQYANEIRAAGASACGIATSATRRAANAGVFVSQVERIIGAPLEVLQGEREAEFSFRGATAHLRDCNTLVGVLDVGGGSAEFAVGHTSIEKLVSCEIGAVRLSEAIPALLSAEQPASPAEVEALERQARHYARERLAPLRDFPRVATAFAVGGTMFNAASIIKDVDRDAVDGAVLAREELSALARRFLSMSVETRRAQPRVTAQRADILPAGLIIVDEALGLAGVDRCTISLADLLYGYLVDRYGT
jgi:exopolyphosphatase/guanosine-5'-triphosphate,3'-diphosphate pyrophosphatase